MCDTKLVYDNDDIENALYEFPDLLDFVLTIAKKKYRKDIIKKYIKDYKIPCGDYKDMQISNMNIKVLKSLLKVSAFKTTYPLVYYSAEHFVKYKKF